MEAREKSRVELAAEKFLRTDLEARAKIAADAEERRKKTERLRALRLADGRKISPPPLGSGLMVIAYL